MSREAAQKIRASVTLGIQEGDDQRVFLFEVPGADGAAVGRMNRKRRYQLSQRKHAFVLVTVGDDSTIGGRVDCGGELSMV